MAVLVGFALITVFAVYRVGHQHQEAAVVFWGDLYVPEEDSHRVDWGFVGNIVVPQGGPMIATGIAGVCEETPLPMVPIKVSSNGKGKVLCGVGTESLEIEFDVESIEDQDLRKAVVEVIDQGGAGAVWKRR